MRTLSLLVALTLSLAACGGSSDPAALNDEGYQALNSGNHAEAVAKFDAALTAIGSDTSNDQYLRGMWGLIEASSKVDPERAQEDFLALARTNSATISAKDYSKVGSWLMASEAFTEATYVVDAGIQAYPETPALQKMIGDIASAAAAAGDEEATGALSGLGYLGE